MSNQTGPINVSSFVDSLLKCAFKRASIPHCVPISRPPPPASSHQPSSRSQPPEGSLQTQGWPGHPAARFLGPLHRARCGVLASEHVDREVFTICRTWVYLSTTPTSVDAAPSAGKAAAPSSLLVSTLTPNIFHLAG